MRAAAHDAENALANPDTVRVWAGRVYLARDLKSWYGRRRAWRSGVAPRALQQVGSIEPCGMHAYPHLVGHRFGPGNLLDLEDFRAARCRDHRCTHMQAFPYRHG